MIVLTAGGAAAAGALMARHPRLRRVAGWAGLAILALLAGQNLPPLYRPVP